MVQQKSDREVWSDRLQQKHKDKDAKTTQPLAENEPGTSTSPWVACRLVQCY